MVEKNIEQVFIERIREHMVKFAKDNIEICIETISLDDRVKFLITIPIDGYPDVTEAFRSARFEVDDYETFCKNVRFACMVGSYEKAAEKYSIFVGSLRKNGFEIIKQREKRYSQREIFEIFSQSVQ